MGRRRRGIRLIFLLFCTTMVISSPALQQQIFPTESSYQQNNRHGKDGVTNQIDRRYSASSITVSNGIGHGSASRGSAAAGGGDGGGRTPHSGGGSAVIPVYAAGSAQARHRQGRPHNAGNRYENNMGLLLAAAVASLLISLEFSDIKAVSIGTQEHCYMC